MEIAARAVPHPVFPDGPEERCGHGSGSRRTPVSRTVAIYDDRHVSVDVPSSIAPRLSRSLEKEVFFVCFLHSWDNDVPDGFSTSTCSRPTGKLKVGRTMSRQEPIVSRSLPLPLFP